MKRGWLPGHVDEKAVTEMHEACRDPWYIPQGPLPPPHYLEAVSVDSYSITETDASLEIMESYSNGSVHASDNSIRSVSSSNVIALLAFLSGMAILFALRRYRNIFSASWVHRKSELYRDLSGDEEADIHDFRQKQPNSTFYQTSQEGMPNKILSI